MRPRCSVNQHRWSPCLGVAIIGLLVISGCSNKAVYENLQHNARLACERQPPATYDECIKQTNQDYDSYSRERKRLLKKRES